MAKITKPVCKVCRRNAEKLYLKGGRCESDKCPLDPRKQRKGMMAAKTSEFGLQLREKNKVKSYYGVFEKQFRKYFSMAKKMKGVTGEILLRLLECRLDNVVYKLNWAFSRRMARQMVSHGHVFVNGKRVNRASYQVKIGDEISIGDNSRFLEIAKNARETGRATPVPVWLEASENEMKAKVVRYPTRDEVSIPVDEHLIINFYSK
ncbi:MAG TPA: 30S ribosomal protein S4 [bacterium]|nr:30S ribosomal protein S4 [bacterium]HOL49280.1 30S ribosomal protein S4 [bacterium]HPO51421.1 30S ribosomal protein S4 [bacterium]HXK44776.1 30S ribosomal protein S4 [bacterium]